MPMYRRSLPELPPSSATPIIAVICRVCSLRPLSSTDSPVPPPIATTFRLLDFKLIFVAIGELKLLFLAMALFFGQVLQSPFQKLLVGLPDL